MTSQETLLKQISFIEQGKTLYNDKREIQVFQPPIPVYAASGQNNYTTWNDLVQLIGADAIGRQINGQQKYLNTMVHWYGKIIGIDAQNNGVKIKMNPSLTPDVQYADITLLFDKSSPVNPFGNYVGQSIDFVGKLIKFQPNEIQMQYLPFQIYERPEVPKDLQGLLEKNGKSVEELQNTLKSSPLWEQYLSEAYPFMVKTMFAAAKPLNVALTVEVVSIQGTQIKGKTNPPGASKFMGPGGYDVIITPGGAAKIPPNLKPGVLVSGLGNLTAIEDNNAITLTAQQIIVHDKPGTSLASIPVNITKPKWDSKSIEMFNTIKQRGQQLHQFLSSIRGLSRASSVSSQSSASGFPTSTLAKPVIKIPTVKPSIKGPKAQAEEAETSKTDTEQHQSQEIENEAKESEPNKQNEPEQEQQQEKHPEDDEKVEEDTAKEEAPEDPNKPKPIYDENGRVKLDEERNEFMGKDVSDVALELMKSAPKTAYTQPVSLDYMADEDDVIQRVRAMKENGFLNEFNNKADDVLDQLNQFVQNSKQGIIGAGYQSSGYDTYGTSTYDTYGNYNDYNNYGSYDTGYNSNYDYTSTNYNTDYGSYQNTGYDQNNQYGDYNNYNYGGNDYNNNYGNDYQNNNGGGNYSGW